MVGAARLCMSLVDECNTASHTQAIGSGEDLPGGKEGELVVMAESSPSLMSSAFFSQC